jgi:hypothetical protein
LWLIASAANHRTLEDVLTGGGEVMRIPSARELVFNLKYAIAMIRVHYRRVPDPLPDADDIDVQGAYYKHFYNTPFGAGSALKYIADYRRYAG